MAGILELLQKANFRCYAPKDSNLPHFEEYEDNKRMFSNSFENPKPSSNQISIQDLSPNDSQIFKFFIDGSMRTTLVGHVVDGKSSFLPIFIAQVAVAVTELESKGIRIEEYRSKNIFFFPDAFSEKDNNDVKNCVTDAANSSRCPLDFEFLFYIVDQITEPIAKARQSALSSMHKMEIDLIKHLADSEKIKREKMLMIDGSLQFYDNLDQAREAFRNVVGVAKSFDLHKRIGRGRNSKQVGAVVAGLRQRHRTPVWKVGESDHTPTVGAWYLRLHSPTHIAGLGIEDGVVKLEVFPEKGPGNIEPIETSKCDLISRNVLALRHPTTPSFDSRWASHLYPIHLTERYIRTRFRDDRTVKAYL